MTLFVTICFRSNLHGNLRYSQTLSHEQQHADIPVLLVRCTMPSHLIQFLCLLRLECIQKLIQQGFLHRAYQRSLGSIYESVAVIAQKHIFS